MPCSRCSRVPTQLQPPPEIAAAPPRCASFSMTTTWAPASCASRPAATPTAPEPTIKTSVRLDVRSDMCIAPLLLHVLHDPIRQLTPCVLCAHDPAFSCIVWLLADLRSPGVCSGVPCLP